MGRSGPHNVRSNRYGLNYSQLAVYIVEVNSGGGVCQRLKRGLVASKRLIEVHIWLVVNMIKAS